MFQHLLARHVKFVETRLDDHSDFALGDEAAGWNRISVTVAAAEGRRIALQYDETTDHNRLRMSQERVQTEHCVRGRGCHLAQQNNAAR
jgi:hypothetical protein